MNTGKFYGRNKLNQMTPFDYLLIFTVFQQNLFVYLFILA